MKEIEKLVLEVIGKFSTQKRKSIDIFNDFIKYFYFSIDKKINSLSKDSLRNKYNKMRQSALQYIIANKADIIKQIQHKVSK
jgi:hypothetical protein